VIAPLFYEAAEVNAIHRGAKFARAVRRRSNVPARMGERWRSWSRMPGHLLDLRTTVIAAGTYVSMSTGGRTGDGFIGAESLRAARAV